MNIDQKVATALENLGTPNPEKAVETLLNRWFANQEASAHLSSTLPQQNETQLVVSKQCLKASSEESAQILVALMALGYSPERIQNMTEDPRVDQTMKMLGLLETEFKSVLQYMLTEFESMLGSSPSAKDLEDVEKIRSGLNRLTQMTEQSRRDVALKLVRTDKNASSIAEVDEISQMFMSEFGVEFLMDPDFGA